MTKADVLRAIVRFQNDYISTSSNPTAKSYQRWAAHELFDRVCKSNSDPMIVLDIFRKELVSLACEASTGRGGFSIAADTVRDISNMI